MFIHISYLASYCDTLGTLKNPLVNILIKTLKMNYLFHVIFVLIIIINSN